MAFRGCTGCRHTRVSGTAAGSQNLFDVGGPIIAEAAGGSTVRMSEAPSGGFEGRGLKPLPDFAQNAYATGAEGMIF